jgi:hypothetical protein
MHLPDMQLLLIYGRLAWGIVLAALLISLIPRRIALSRPIVGALTIAMLALQALPGAASPTYSLALALQWPSGLLTGLCLAKLSTYKLGSPTPMIPPIMALLLALAGIVIYLDVFGLTALGLYYRGFGPHAAPAVGLLLAALAALAIARAKYRPQASAVLLAMMAFAILRLPTGNIWDALLDPLLWAWALVTLAGHGWQRIMDKRGALPQAA